MINHIGIVLENCWKIKESVGNIREYVWNIREHVGKTLLKTDGKSWKTVSKKHGTCWQEHYVYNRTYWETYGNCENSESHGTCWGTSWEKHGNT